MRVCLNWFPIFKQRSYLFCKDTCKKQYKKKLTYGQKTENKNIDNI
jgi:hypothetical protein